MNATLPIESPCNLALREPRSGDPARERLILLGLVYLQAGLPPDAAYRSALADYVCGIGEVANCG